MKYVIYTMDFISISNFDIKIIQLQWMNECMYNSR